MSVSKPHMRLEGRHSASFFTFERPCEEALSLLAEAYNRLADQIDTAWENNTRLVEQLETAQFERDQWEKACSAMEQSAASLGEQVETCERDRAQECVWRTEAELAARDLKEQLGTAQEELEAMRDLAVTRGYKLDDLKEQLETARQHAETEIPLAKKIVAEAVARRDELQEQLEALEAERQSLSKSADYLQEQLETRELELRLWAIGLGPSPERMKELRDATHPDSIPAKEPVTQADIEHDLGLDKPWRMP